MNNQKDILGKRAGGLGGSGRCTLPGLLGLLLLLGLPAGTQAQVWAIEGLPWQFQTSADQANKAIVLDIMERKKGGYYDAFEVNNYVNNYNTTNIERQFNCGVSAMASGNVADTTQSAQVSSPNTANTSGNSADAAGNSSTTTTDAGYGWQAGSGTQSSTDQSNKGDVDAGVYGSPSRASSGPINASGGYSRQALNVSQSNSGKQVAYVTGSVGCDFGSGMALN
ncbi:hypothetical protein [Castellaniella sp.]|uniref:hypothetical protein n=1 Tax=Castellaniella sp. TaxID=1955812 RepID=UPI003568ADA0